MTRFISVLLIATVLAGCSSDSTSPRSSRSGSESAVGGATASGSLSTSRLDLRSVDWANSSVPGAACGGTGAVQLHRGSGLVSSSRWPDAWSGPDSEQMPSQVEVDFYGPVRFGDLLGNGSDAAIVPIWCTNGGGTAAGQLGQSLVVFTKTDSSPVAIGIIDTAQPGTYHTPYFDNSLTHIEVGKVTVEELWYGAKDGTCCPTGQAEDVWTFNGTTLTRLSSTVKASPTS